jgi:hypothetical protein
MVPAMDIDAALMAAITLADILFITLPMKDESDQRQAELRKFE